VRNRIKAGKTLSQLNENRNYSAIDVTLSLIQSSVWHLCNQVHAVTFMIDITMLLPRPFDDIGLSALPCRHQSPHLSALFRTPIPPNLLFFYIFYTVYGTYNQAGSLCLSSSLYSFLLRHSVPYLFILLCQLTFHFFPLPSNTNLPSRQSGLCIAKSHTIAPNQFVRHPTNSTAPPNSAG